MILSLITYPLSPKIKPILTVYANVSELPPPLLQIILFSYELITNKRKEIQIHGLTYGGGGSFDTFA